MAFLPGSGVPLTNMALLTEKEGKLWLVDVTNGKRTAVSGVPSVVVAGQGGLGDVMPHPDFAGNQRVYLSYVEGGAERHERRGARLWHARPQQCRRAGACATSRSSGGSSPRSAATAISPIASPSGPTASST